MEAWLVLIKMMPGKNGEKSRFIFGEGLLIFLSPEGESLKDTAERVLPYFKAYIMPKVMQGTSILVAAPWQFTEGSNHGTRFNIF